MSNETTDVFMSYEWGMSHDRKTLRMSRRDVLSNALDMLMNPTDPEVGKSLMERAARRACVKRGMRKILEELENDSE